MNSVDLRQDERAGFALRSLYRSYGYAPYHMSKFEEYELYVRNKDFLVSDHVITFTDATGRLLALKPDVTLSIVKNSRLDGNGVQKVYYNEKVYRTSQSSHEFHEITQVGLECMGRVDAYALCEVLTLAARSLAELSDDFVLEVSHLDIVSRLLDGMGIDGQTRARLLSCIADKNTHDIETVCREVGVDEDRVVMLRQLVGAYGTVGQVMPVLRGLAEQDAALCEPLGELCRVLSALEDNQATRSLRIDFSLINDMNYYNGIVFRGYIKGVPTRILSGGQYDGLMQKMGKSARAVGFAVYLDLLEHLRERSPEYDVDTVILYGQTTEPSDVCRAVEQSVKAGEQTIALRALPPTLRYRRLVRLDGKEKTAHE
ncbi:MAG: ATP phosphoribosyltransferase regulatory subunit [Clostridia bacterium]|nr:ATP phosphoribosyltransferase regulatory subunit [Clostridia bacterium]